MRDASNGFACFIAPIIGAPFSGPAALDAENNSASRGA